MFKEIRACAICGEDYPFTELADEDTKKHAHIHCFFDKQQYLECGKEATSFIRNNPINDQWYIYNYDNDYKHNETPIRYCPFCGKLLSKHGKK